MEFIEADWDANDPKDREAMTKSGIVGDKVWIDRTLYKIDKVDDKIHLSRYEPIRLRIDVPEYDDPDKDSIVQTVRSLRAEAAGEYKAKKASGVKPRGRFYTWFSRVVWGEYE